MCPTGLLRGDVAALTVLGSPDWPRKRAWSVGAAAVAIGLGYTAYSEHLNTSVRKAWAYSNLMPTLPWLGTGLAPVAQWLLVPTLSLAWGCRAWSPHPATHEADSSARMLPASVMLETDTAATPVKPMGLYEIAFCSPGSSRWACERQSWFRTGGVLPARRVAAS